MTIQDTGCHVWLLERMAYGYIKNYMRLGISKSSTYTDITIRELNFFASLGEHLGFLSILESGKADLIWKDPKSNKIVLYLERETMDGRIVTETIRKLETKACGAENCSHDLLRVGILGWSTEESLEHITDAAKKMPMSLFIAWIGAKKESVQKIGIFLNNGSSFKAIPCKGQLVNDYWTIQEEDQGDPEWNPLLKAHISP